MDMQALVDSFSEQWRRERSQTQMTLGKMIESLEAMPEDARVAMLQNAHSYRGYYSDLAFEPVEDETCLASALLAECRDALGETFVGYKGGDFQMDEDTPVFVAFYGCTGKKLMGFAEDGSLQTAEDNT